MGDHPPERPLPRDGDGDRPGGEVGRREERATAGAAVAPVVGHPARAWTPGAGLRCRPRAARQRGHLAAGCGEPARLRFRSARRRPSGSMAMAGVGRRPPATARTARRRRGCRRCRPSISSGRGNRASPWSTSGWGREREDDHRPYRGAAAACVADGGALRRPEEFPVAGRLCAGARLHARGPRARRRPAGLGADPAARRGAGGAGERGGRGDRARGL